MYKIFGSGKESHGKVEECHREKKWHPTHGTSYCRFDLQLLGVFQQVAFFDLVQLSFAPENFSLQQIKRARKTLENEASWISRALGA